MRDSFHDLETFSPVPIKDGTHRYAEQAEVMLWAYALEDGTVKVWDLVNKSVHWQDELSGVWMEAPCKGTPVDLDAQIHDPQTLVWFQNGGHFDFIVLKHARPDLLPPMARRRDTMVQAFAHALPGSLDKLGSTLGLAEDKRKIADGKRLVQLFCKPQSETFQAKWGTDRATKQTHPQEWQRFIEYAAGDIVTMREAHRLMPTWNYKGKQIDLWHLDCVINERGFAVDLELAEAAVRNADKAKADLARATREATKGAVGAATQRDELLKYLLAEHGVELPDMRADTLERRLADPDLPEAVRELIAIRLQASMNSVSKFKTLLKGVSRDGRLRGCMQFRGAGRTGRWAHRMFQPGNLLRPTMSHEQIELAIKALKTDCADLIFDNVMEACGNTVRGVIISPPGRKLVIADLANIEGRGAAWMAGEEWKVQAFRDFDNGIGHDLYILAYAKAFGVDPAAVPKKGPERQIGKVCIAEGQLVLTDCGLVPIQRVTREMRVWDGVEWVEHAGVIYNGIRDVITYEGVTATPDHKVWIHGSPQPVPLEHAAASGSRLVESGADRCPVRVVVGDVTDSALHARVEHPVCPRPMHGLRQGDVDPLREPDPRSEHGLQRLRAREADPAVALAAVRCGAPEMHESQEPGVAELRGAGDRVSLPVGDRGRGVHDREVRAAPQIAGDRPEEQRRALRERQLALGDEQRESPEYPACVPSRVAAGDVALFEERSVSPLGAGHDEGADPGGCLARGLGEAQELARHTRKVRVFDIANAGPRHRFTVSGKLVANCELMFQYGGGVGAWITGAATYGIDLGKMTEQVWGTLPEWAKKEAEDFLHWLYEQKTAKLREKMQKLDDSVTGGDLHPDEVGAEWAELEAQCEAAKLKARYGLPEKTFIACDAIKRLWRKAHPMISTYWKQLEDTVRKAIDTPGVTFPCRKVKIRRDGAWLRIGLPSGRALCYPNPRITKDGSIAYTGLNQYSRQWGEVRTYSGKLFENIVQAIAADQLAECMPPAEAAGYRVALHVHDELICEAPDEGEYTAEKLGTLMCSPLPWNAGLPLAAAGFETYRYRKD